MLQYVSYLKQHTTRKGQQINRQLTNSTSARQSMESADRNVEFLLKGNRCGKFALYTGKKDAAVQQTQIRHVNAHVA